MSNVGCDPDRMNDELGEIVAGLDAAQRAELADKMEQWVHEIRASLCGRICSLCLLKTSCPSRAADQRWN